MKLLDCPVCDNSGEAGLYFDMTHDCPECDGLGVQWRCEICGVTGDGPSDICICTFDDLEQIYEGAAE